MRILTLNAGSTSVKCGLLVVADATTPPRAEASAEASGLGSGRASASLQTADGATIALDLDGNSPATVLPGLLRQLRQHLPTPDALAHRIVHGGDRRAPARVDPDLLAALQALEPLAPLHQPAGIAGIEAGRTVFPDLPQTACFDTAFFADLPEEEQVLPLPRKYAREGVRRYGFHGLAYTDVVHQLGADLGERALLAHLGGGCSLTALQGGRPIATTMGLTPDGGLPMATRSGDLDPGVLFYLLRQGLSTDALEDLLSRQSGLAGLSGLSGDMRELEEAAEAGAEDARLARAIFSRRLRAQVGAYAALLGGVDTVAFSGGIGEHDGKVRAEALAGLAALGVRPDTRVVAVREDHVLARAARAHADT
jgi:acetate kinase